MALRILFVTPYVPSIVRIRPYAFIRELAKLGHRITLACLVQPEWEESYLAEVSHFCEAVYPVHLRRYEPYKNVLSSLFTRAPLSVAYCDSLEFKQSVKELVGRNGFDLIHTEFVRAAPVTLALNSLPKVYDAVDSLTLAYRRSISAAHISPKQRLVALVEWLKMRDFEPWVLKHFDRTIVSSPADKHALRSDRDGVEVIPNGVDLDYFKTYAGPREAATIVFLGKMSYYVNVASVLWFYRQVFPLVRNQFPHVRFIIVGRNPAKAITALCDDPAVEVTGTVEDVRPYLSKATLAVCPMVSGAGIQNKMLEAMSTGTPCVATSLASQALQAQLGQDLMVAGTVEGFAAAVCELLDDPMCRSQMGLQGRQYVERFHDWTTIGRRLDTLYDGLVSNKKD